MLHALTNNYYDLEIIIYDAYIIWYSYYQVDLWHNIVYIGVLCHS